MQHPVPRVEFPSPDDAVRVYRGQTLTGRIQLDGGQFVDCIFLKATLVYAGGAPPLLQGCQFHASSFEFDGPAGRTFAFLKAMAAPASGLRDVFKSSFPTLFGH